MGAKSYDGSLLYDTEIDTSGFEKGSKQIKNKADETGNAVKKKAAETTSDVNRSAQETKDTLDGLNKTAKAVLLTAASVGAGILSMGISYNSQMENYKTSFEVMTGSADKAAEAVERLKKMGAATPFELPQLAETTQLLMNYGFTVDEAIDRMSMLGDISQGNADKLGRIAMAYGQMSSAGKVALEDVKQMIEAGFNPLQEISQTTGESMESLYDRISKGTISVDEITASMQRATSEGGKYFQSMEKQSQTLQGQWSTLKDNVSALTGQMAEDISEKLTTTVLPELIDMVDKFSQMWEDGTLQAGIRTVVSALGALGAVIVVINIALFVRDMINLVKATKDFTAATKLATTAQKLFNAAQNSSKIGIIVTAVIGLIAALGTYASVQNAATNAMESSSETARRMFDEYNDVIESIEKAKNEQIASAEVAKSYRDELFRLENQLKSGNLTQEEANIVEEEFRIIAEKLTEIIPQISDYLFDETGQIDVQTTAVDNLVDSYYKLVVAKAKASAAEDVIKQAYSSILNYRTQQKMSEDTINKTVAQIEGYDVKVQRNDDGSIRIMENGVVETEGLHDEFGDWWRNLTTGRDTTVLNLAKDLADEVKVFEGYGNEIARLEDDITFYTEELKNADVEVGKIMSESGLNDNSGGSHDGTHSSSGGGTHSGSRNGTSSGNEPVTIVKNELQELKHYLAMGKISELEYYQTLEKYRDEYLTEGSSEWQQYTEEINRFNEDSVEYYVDLLADAQDEANDMLDELEQKRQSIADGLKSDKSPVEYGTINGEKFVNLANYDKENYKLERYSQMLDELFEKRPDLPSSVLMQLQGMDIDQGMKYVEALLRASDSQYSAHIKGPQLEEENAKKVSSKLMSDELDEAKKILEDKFGQLPEDFYDIGADSMSFFGEGFISGLGILLQSVRDQIYAEMSTLSSGAIAFNSAGGDSSSVVNNYNNSYNIGSNKETVTEQLEGITRFETMQRLRDKQ